MTYWFTVAKTGQRKPLHQICTCSKTMLQISLELCPRLVMVLMESRVLNQFKIFKLLQTLYYSMHTATIRLQSMLKKHYSQTSSLRCLKPVILRENDIQREEIQCYHKNICLNLLYESNIRAWFRQHCFYASNIQYKGPIFKHKGTAIFKQKGPILNHHFCLILSQKQTFVTKVKKT